MQGVWWRSSASLLGQASILILDVFTKLLKPIDGASFLEKGVFHFFDVYALDQMLLDLRDGTDHDYPFTWDIDGFWGGRKSKRVAFGSEIGPSSACLLLDWVELLNSWYRMRENRQSFSEILIRIIRGQLLEPDLKLIEGVNIGLLKVLDDWLELSIKHALRWWGMVEMLKLQVHFILL